MKSSIGILFLVLLSAFCFSQSLNQVWLLSTYTSNPFKPRAGIDFTTSSADTFTMTRKMTFYITEAEAFDSSGALLFYTNGVYIANKNHDTLLNCENFNPGWGTDFYNPGGLGYPQGAVIIPKPGTDSYYYVFHITNEQIYAYGQYDSQPLNFRVSEIDMILDGGLGGVVEGRKNIHLIEDTVSQGRITACRHANGRDWWVITHKFHSDKYYIIHVTPDSFIVKEQNIGKVLTSNDIYGMAVFSPDGNWYAHINTNDTLDLFNFDRCQGELKNWIELTVPIGPYGTVGCSFSPNSQFMYVNDLTSIYQFDLTAQDIQQSIVKVAEWDSTYIPFATWFLIPQLAPDGKIYISTYNGTWRLHVINEPDNAGLSCNVTQHSFVLPQQAQSNLTLPNLPNYSLGTLTNSPCDTLGLGIKDELISSFSVYPNPATTYFNVRYHIAQTATVSLLDLYGRQVKSWLLHPYFDNKMIFTEDILPGMYVVTLTTESGATYSRKVLIMSGH